MHILPMVMEMRKNWKTYAFWIALAEGVGALAGWLTREGNALYQATAVKPPLEPPALVFPIVWTILYALMGIGAARVSLTEDSDVRSRGLNLFVVQLAMNFVWTILFFNFQAYGAALVLLLILWIVIAWMTLEFQRADPAAGWLQVPYLVWVLFALFLNYWVWKLNG